VAEVIIDGVRYVPQKSKFPVQMSLGSLIKQRRVSHKWTLENLAFAAGLSKSTVWELENDRHAPSFVVAAKLAIVLGIDLADMAATIPYSEQLRARAILAKAKDQS